MKLTGESKVLLGIVAATIAIVVIASFVFTKPTPTISKEDLITKTSHTKGNPQATVYLVEFSDYQCPACKAVHPLVEQITEQYKDNLLFAYRHYPLDQHPFSQKAAAAAQAAGEQNKFWEYSSLLFENQEKFDDALFPALARELGLNEQTFITAMNSDTVQAVVTNDRLDGNRFGVNATPTFFLNGKKLELASFDDLASVVKQAVEK